MHKNCVLREDRLRRVPARFSWIDHRLIRDGYAQRCRVIDLAVYLVLVSVADRNGMSFYSDRSLCNLLDVLPGELAAARRHLCELGLLEWCAPFYQVLSLEPVQTVQTGLIDEEPPATAAQIEAVVKGFLGRRA